MASEENTDEGRIERIIDQRVNLPQTGVVTKVREHADPDDVWDYDLDVRIGPERHPRRVPFAVPTPELAAPPRSSDHPEGPDLVLVQFIQDNDEQRPVATDILYNDEDRAPLGEEGIFRLRRGSLYTEMHPLGEWARIAAKPGDDQAPSTKVEIDDSGSTTKVNIETDGDISLSAGGDIVIDEGGTAVPVAKQNHDHDVVLSDGSTATTQTPNQNGTKTEIE